MTDDETLKADFADYLQAAGYTPRETEIAERRAKATKGYFETKRDDDVARFLTYLRNNVATAAKGGRMKRRALFVIGKSGSGKTRSLEWQFDRHQAFKPYLDRHGNRVRPLIAVRAPSPYSNKEFAKAIIKDILGVPPQGNLTEPEWFELLRDMIRTHKVFYLWIDEAQHARRGIAAKEVEKLQNILKELVQMSWPLNVIYSGVEDVSFFLRQKDGQIANRAYVMRYHSMPMAAVDTATELAKTVIVEYCGLKADSAVLSAEFIQRLIQAGDGCLGTMSDIVREACFLAYDRDEDKIGKAHFVRAYEHNSGCLASENIFRSPRWAEIETKYALNDLPDGSASRQR